MGYLRFATLAVALAWMALNATAENWPQWRGPNGDGISRETGVPTQWDTTRNVGWKTPIPGEGHSSPVVSGQAVFLTTAAKEKGERFLIRLDADTGKVIWKQLALTAPVEAMHRENSAASSTPVTDGTYVFTSFQNGPRVDVQGYDFSGRKVWEFQQLPFKGMHGYSYTPVLAGDLVIFDFCQNQESAVIALDKKTGRQRWRYDRKKQEISHVTPLVIKGQQNQLVVCGGDEVRSFDPMSGKSLWWADGPSDVCVAGMAFGDGAVFVTSGFPKRARMAIKTNGRGDVTQSHVTWSATREVTYVPSPVFCRGHLYTVVDDGLLYCFDAKTGRATWNERIGGRFRSSLVLADGHIYATNDKGVTTVFRANAEKYMPAATNDLAEFCYATPAVANSRIYMRTGGNLYCIAEGKDSSAAASGGK